MNLFQNFKRIFICFVILILIITTVYAKDSKSFIPKDSSMYVYVQSAKGFEDSLRSYASSLGMLAMIMQQNNSQIPEMLKGLKLQPPPKADASPLTAEDFGVKSNGDFAFIITDRKENTAAILPYSSGPLLLKAVRAPIISKIEKRSYKEIPYEYTKDLVNNKEKSWAVLGDYFILADSEIAIKKIIDSALDKKLSIESSDSDMEFLDDNGTTNSLKLKVHVSKLVNEVYKPEIDEFTSNTKTLMMNSINQANQIQAQQNPSANQQPKNKDFGAKLLSAYFDILLDLAKQIEVGQFSIKANSQILQLSDNIILKSDSKLNAYLPQTTLPAKPLSVYFENNGFVKADYALESDKYYNSINDFLDYVRPKIFADKTEEQFQNIKSILESCKPAIDSLDGEAAVMLTTDTTTTATAANPLPNTIKIVKVKDPLPLVNLMKDQKLLDNVCKYVFDDFLGTTDSKITISALPSSQYKGMKIEGAKYENYMDIIKNLNISKSSQMSSMLDQTNKIAWIAYSDKENVVIISTDENQPILLKKVIDFYIQNKGNTNLILNTPKNLPKEINGYCSISLVGYFNMIQKMMAAQPNNPSAQMMANMPTTPNVNGDGVTIYWAFNKSGANGSMIIPASEIMTLSNIFMMAQMSKMQQGGQAPSAPPQF